MSAFAPSRRRRRGLLASLGAVAVLLGAAYAGWRVMFRDSSDPVSVDDAVSSFRSQPGREGAAGGTPAPGVYVYRTAGGESLRDAPLGDARHAYPRMSAVVVARGGCGFVETWVPLDTRARESTLCATRRGLTITDTRETRSFFGIDSPREFDCAGSVPASPPANGKPATWTSTCSVSGSSSFTETARSRLVGRERLTVGGRPVRAVHVRDELELSGETRGRATRHTWRRAADGLLLRQEYREQSVVSSHVGELRFADRYRLALTSLEPRR